jgi:hypothetical protein
MWGKIALTIPVLVVSGSAIACGPATLTLGRVQSTTQNGDIRIEDGPLLKLAGLHIAPGATPEMPAPGSRIAYGRLDDEPDRWGRIPAIVMLGEEKPDPRWLQERWIAGGHAVARPEPDLGTCWALLTATEARHLNMLPALPAEAGRFARIEGRIGRVADARGTTFLSVFEKSGKRTAGMIQKRHIGRFTRAGIDVSRLNGQLVRIRGLRSARNADVIPLIQPEQIEIIR